MATFSEALTTAVRNTFCAYLQTVEGFQRWLFEDDLFPTTPPSLAFARFMLRYHCNTDPPAFSAPPFQGGQCVGVSYDVTIYRDIKVGANSVRGYPEPITVRGNGPIRGLYLEYGAGGITSLRINWGSSQPSIGSTISSSEYWYAYYITNVVRVGGLPDNCGNWLNPPTTPVPSTPVIVPVSYTTNNSVNVTTAVTLTYAPFRVHIDGTINVPFRLRLDPSINVDVNGNLNLSTGDVNIHFGNPNFSPSSDPNQDSYDTPDDVPDYPPTVPNSIAPIPPQPDTPSTEAVIRAVIVTVTAYDSNATIIPQDLNPDIYAPNLGFVNFAIATKGAIAWTSDIAVKNFRNFIPCPWEGGAIQVRGTPRPGVTWDITPVRVVLEEPVIFS